MAKRKKQPAAQTTDVPPKPPHVLAVRVIDPPPRPPQTVYVTVRTKTAFDGQAPAAGRADGPTALARVKEAFKALPLKDQQGFLLWLAQGRPDDEQ